MTEAESSASFVPRFPTMKRTEIVLYKAKLIVPAGKLRTLKYSHHFDMFPCALLSLSTYTVCHSEFWILKWGVRTVN